MKLIHPSFSKKSPLFERTRRGYTLLEIMLVLSIIAVLLSAGIYYLVGNLDVAREQRVGADIATITTQLRVYEMQNLTLPTTEQGLDALVERPTSEPVPQHWSKLMERKGLLDPWGMPYQYVYPGKHNPQGFDLFSMGPDRVVSGDDIGNWDTDSK